MKISYYDLLIKLSNGEIPDIIKLELNCEERYYQAFYDNNEFNYYGLCDEDLENADFHYYLSDTLLESQMFDKCIEIIEEDKKIEKLENEIEFYSYSEYESYKNEIDRVLYILKGMNLTEEKIKNMNNNINKLIDEVNRLKNKQ